MLWSQQGRAIAAFAEERFDVLFQELPSVMLPVENGNIFPYSPEADSPAAEGTGMPS